MTANQLFKLYMSMSYEDRQEFLLMFKAIYSFQETTKGFNKSDECND